MMRALSSRTGKMSSSWIQLSTLFIYRDSPVGANEFIEARFVIWGGVCLCPERASSSTSLSLISNRRAHDLTVIASPRRLHRPSPAVGGCPWAHSLLHRGIQSCNSASGERPWQSLFIKASRRRYLHRRMELSGLVWKDSVIMQLNFQSLTIIWDRAKKMEASLLE